MTGAHFSLGWSLELGTENGQLDADSCRPKLKQIRFVRRHSDVARRGNSCSVGLRSAPRRTVSETARRCLGLWARLPSHWSHDRSDRTATTSTEPIEKSDRRDRSISIGSRKPYDSPRNQRTTFTPGAYSRLGKSRASEPRSGSTSKRRASRLWRRQHRAVDF